MYSPNKWFCFVLLVGIGIGIVGSNMSLDNPEGIGNWIRFNIPYTSDVIDHWQTPEETLERRAGDCEDHAILAQHFLKNIGIRGEIVYFTLMVKGEYKAHAICVFKENGVFNYISTERYQKVNGKSVKDCCDWSARRAGAKKSDWYLLYTDKMVEDKIKETKDQMAYSGIDDVGTGWKKTPEEFRQAIEESLRTHRIVILEISTTWCGSCKKLEEAKEDPRNVELLKRFDKVWIDADKYPELKMEYGVRAYPSLFFFKDGKIVERSVGGMNGQSLIYVLEHVLRRFENV